MKHQSHAQRNSPRIAAIQTSRYWHVSPHHHSGHLLPSRSTSYPILLMMVLCTGIFLASWTRIVTADSNSGSGNYVVHASVPGPAPAIPAIITNPVADTDFSAEQEPISVSGSCPSGSYVSLYRNDFFSGVGLCDPTGAWQISTDLFNGQNDLQARVFSMTDEPGPIDPGSNVTVTYTAPVVVTPPTTPITTPTEPTSSSTPAATTPSTVTASPPASTGLNPVSSSTPTTAATHGAEPLTLASNFAYIGVYANQVFTQHLDLEGGTAPYALNINWGDGKQQLFSRPGPGGFAITHMYAKAGGFHGSYVIKIAITDALGNQSFLQLLSIVNSHYQTNAGVATSSSTGGGGLGKTLNNVFSGSYSSEMRYLWPSYGVVVLMLCSFWLGERQEFHHLKPRLKKTRHSHTMH